MPGSQRAGASVPAREEENWEKLKTKRLAIFVPAYNDAETIGAVLSEARASAEEIVHSVYIVVVDDGSTDNTAEAARAHADRVIRTPENRGVGAATKTGLMHLRRKGHGSFDYVVKFDADGQHKPRLIPHMLLELVRGKDIVVASRYHHMSLAKDPPETRIVTNRIMASLVGLIMKRELTDVRSGFMAFQFRIIQAVAPRLKIRRYGIPFELLIRAWNWKRRLVIMEVPSRADYTSQAVARSRIERVRGLSAEKEAARFMEAVSGLLMVLQDEGVRYDRRLLARSLESLTHALTELIAICEQMLEGRRYLLHFDQELLRRTLKRFERDSGLYTDENMVRALGSFVQWIYEILFDIKSLGVEYDLSPFVRALGFRSLETEQADHIADYMARIRDFVTRKKAEAQPTP